MNLNGRPGDERRFLHKRIFGGIKGAVRGLLSGGPVSAVAGGLGGFARGGARALALVPCPAGFTTDASGRCVQVPAPVTQLLPSTPSLPDILPPFISDIFPTRGATNGLPAGSCEPGLVWDAAGGFCTFPGGPRFTGEAQMGQFGAGLVPAFESVNVRKCPRGAVLAVDGLCYNKSAIRNSDRMWPRGRRPLLTGGEMRCISVASAAARKFGRKQKQLQEMGMLPKPARRTKKLLTAGHHAHVEHN